MDKIRPQVGGGTVQVGGRVQSEPEDSYHSLNGQDCGTQPQKCFCHGGNENGCEKTNGESAAGNGNPLCPMIEPVLGMISEAEDKVTNETAQG